MLCVFKRSTWFLEPVLQYRAILLHFTETISHHVSNITASNGHHYLPMSFSYCWHLMRVANVLFLEHAICWTSRTPVPLRVSSYLCEASSSSVLNLYTQEFCFFSVSACILSLREVIHKHGLSFHKCDSKILSMAQNLSYALGLNIIISSSSLHFEYLPQDYCRHSRNKCGFTKLANTFAPRSMFS